MTGFQIVALAFVAAMLVFSVVTATRGRAHKLAVFSWAMVWIGAGVAIALPDLSTVVARALGIQRGADLVFYVAILVMFVGFFMIYIRLKRVEALMTRIVRELALRAPEPPHAVSGDSERGGRDASRAAQA